MKKAQVTIFIIIGLVILLVTLIYLFVSEEEELISLSGYTTCKDGTPANSCSLDRPFFCSFDGSETVLRERCFECGCPSGETCDGTSCRPVDNEQDFNFTIFLVPINYHSEDVDFIQRANGVISMMSSQTNLDEDNFVVVDESLETSLACNIDPVILEVFVDEWYKEKNGVNLPGRTGSDIFPIYDYRVVGLDKTQNSIEECGAGFTYFYSPSVYMGGTSFGLKPEIVAHEFGHTIGLCEEYDTCVWQFQNERYACRNPIPNKFDSDCGEVCCSETAFACCNGKFADLGFNIMGSANIPPHREFNFETENLLNNYICNHYGECETG